MKKIYSFILSLFLLFSLSQSYAQEQGTEADHQALRNLLANSTKAINDNNFDSLRPLLDNKFSIITIDNSKFSTLNDFKTYWDSLFKGDKATLKSITFKPTADEKTYLLTPDIGVVSGTAEQTFYFTDNDVRTMNTRWSAVVHKDNNQWKILNIHFSGNILENPVVTTLKASLYKVAAIGAVVGFLIGLLLMKMIRPKNV